MESNKFICFMAHIPHKEVDYLVKELEQYRYVIGMEKSNYEHFHFLVEMDDKKYHAFSKKVFKDKYKLRGRAIKGLPRQYGKEKQIKDIQKIARYTCKDRNVRTNLSNEELEDLLGQKLEECENTKNESKEKKELCMKYVEEEWEKSVIKMNQGQKNLVLTQIKEEDGYNAKELFVEYNRACHWDHEEICCKIIDWMIYEHIGIRKTTIDSYYYYIISYSKYMRRSSQSIYSKLYLQSSL